MIYLIIDGAGITGYLSEEIKQAPYLTAYIQIL